MLLNLFGNNKRIAKTTLAELTSLRGQVEAISKSQGVIEFNLDGTVLYANQNFLNIIGYTADEAVGKHHSTFIDDSTKHSEAYKAFWAKLNRGEFDTGVYKRIAKGGNEVWIQASYNPILDEMGKPYKVIKFATDITAQIIKDADAAGQLAAINKTQGVIEFTLDGHILNVNENFAAVTGYSASEIIGQHHSIFIDASYKLSPEYEAFWKKLAQGETSAGQYKRVGKNGNQIWLQATYNPIFDLNGKPLKVVKYAVDISAQKDAEALIEGQLEAIGRSLGVIAFTPDGRVIEVNHSFLDTLGYTEHEAIGQHHRLFVDEAYARSDEYREFWSKLNRGEYEHNIYKRFGKHKKEVWIQASYNPIKDVNGKVVKVVKFAVDITTEKTKLVDLQGQMDAINNNQGVIEFSLDAKVVSVNQNFLDIMGYTETETIGKPHSTFVDATTAASEEYREFWAKLRRGEFDSNQYKRVGKGGKEVWLQASYNPIRDLNGNVVKVVKFATDVTESAKVSQSLARAVKEINHVVELTQNNDLSERVSLSGKTDNMLNLSEGINALIDGMVNIVTHVKEAGETINTAAGEIAAGNSDLSQRTEEQASSLEQTAASMEQLASTVKASAENSKVANDLANSASSVALQGGHVVADVVTTMNSISESASKIHDIIGVIDGIAFQTNILALNAAVEAARAGEQGRGFAVVAAEVRQLAQRSAVAAKEIKQLITNSVNQVSDGTKLVEKAGHTMDEVVSSVKKVTEIMNEINQATQEQSTGIDQVNEAVTQMDEVTQQNAALVEQAAAAAESLLHQSDSLMEAVNIYKLQTKHKANYSNSLNQ